MTKPWVDPLDLPVPPALQTAVGGHPLVARALAKRGIVDPAAARAFLDPDCYTPSPPVELPGLEVAADRLTRAIRAQEPVCVWGDFDVDGQTATTILLSCLQELGARVSFHIPLRSREGHGVDLPALQQVIEQGARLVLTCDTGVSAHAAVAFACQRGVDFLITDHHDLPPALPDALAVVNPRLLPLGHPMATLSGAGVAWKLAGQLYTRAGKPEGAADLVDLAALGLVADVATLMGDTRWLVQRGLRALRITRRPGLQALLESAGLPAAYLTEEHIGFAIAPRLNALGRLADASLAVELFTTASTSRARVIALQLEGLNSERQFKTSQIYQGALSQVEQEPSLLAASALVLANPHWEAGVIGIVASRLAQRFERPVVLLACPPGENARGSARSVEGVDISAAIAACGDLLLGYGGHPMAAGLSLLPENILAFRQRLDEQVQEQRRAVPPPSGLAIDAVLSLGELDLVLAGEIERLAPFGAGNPPLTLVARGLALKRSAAIGRTNDHLALTVEDESGLSRRVIWWQAGSDPLPSALTSGRFDLAFRLRATTFRGQRDISLEWVGYRPVPGAAVEIAPRLLEAIDCRDVPLLLERLKEELRSEPSMQVWCEGAAAEALRSEGIPAIRRDQLTPCAALAVWTAPPSLPVLKAALECVRPQRAYIFAVDPGEDTPAAFLRRLAGLVKYALRSMDGIVRLPDLAAATAQRGATIRLGLDWLASRGDIRIVRVDGDAWQLASGGTPDPAGAARLENQLRTLLAETAAYRRYLHKADIDLLVNA